LAALLSGWRTSQCENPEDAVLNRTLLRFLSDESGATAIEYGLIAAGIALAIIAVVNSLDQPQFTI
jgi:pilus assembly protein Flp/PilA